MELKGQPVNKSLKPYFTMLNKHDLTVIPWISRQETTDKKEENRAD